ncbi:MAG: DUF4345 domain-containing protein [Chloroflexota bacterium]
MKLALQIALILGALGPLMVGITSFTQGAAGYLPTGEVPIQLDAHLRALSIWFTVAFFLILWSVRNLEKAGPVLYIIFVLMALSGTARLYSMWSLGEFDPTTVVAAGVEIGTLIFIPSYATFMRNHRTVIQ